MNIFEEVYRSRYLDSFLVTPVFVNIRLKLKRH